MDDSETLGDSKWWCKYQQGVRSQPVLWSAEAAYWRCRRQEWGRLMPITFK